MGSKVIRGTQRQTGTQTHRHTDKQTGYLISLLSFFESREKQARYELWFSVFFLCSSAVGKYYGTRRERLINENKMQSFLHL
jgi:hypothetical protein